MRFNYSEYGQTVSSKFCRWFERGNAIKVVVKNEQRKVLIELPLTVVLVFSLFAPALIGIALVVAVMRGCRVELNQPEKPDKKESAPTTKKSK